MIYIPIKNALVMYELYWFLQCALFMGASEYIGNTLSGWLKKTVSLVSSVPMIHR